jgi:hypothetical protein
MMLVVNELQNWMMIGYGEKRVEDRRMDYHENSVLRS